MLTSAVVLGASAAASRMASAQPRGQLPSVIDAAFDTTPILSNLRKRGVRTIFRYYAAGFQPSLPSKRLMKDEADAIWSTGLSIGAVYQLHNNVLANMNSIRGAADARYSLEYASNVIGQAQGSAIYFGVDGDWPSEIALRGVLSYFEAINAEFARNGNRFVIGVYGSGKTCRELSRLSLAHLFWLPKSTGWTGTREVYNDGRWTLYQNMHEVSVAGSRGRIDTNLILGANIGAFSQSGLTTVEQPPTVFSSRRFVRPAGARLLEQPRTEARVITHLQARSNVAVLSEEGPWSGVSTGETGQVSGYTLTRDLQSMATMP